MTNLQSSESEANWFFEKDAFEVAAQPIIERIVYAKMPPRLKKSINFKLIKTINTATSVTTQSAHTTEHRHWEDVELQMS